jgi:hypothetical protein
MNSDSPIFNRNTTYLILVCWIAALAIIYQIVKFGNRKGLLWDLWRFYILQPKSERADGPNDDPDHQDYEILFVTPMDNYWGVELVYSNYLPTMSHPNVGHRININICRSFSYAPQAGDRLRIYGDPQTLIHGLTLNDTVLFWLRPSQCPVLYHLTPRSPSDTSTPGG